MKRSILAAFAVLAGAAGLGAFVWPRSEPAREEPAPAAPGAERPDAAPAPPATERAEPAIDPLADYEARLLVQADFEDFVRNAERLAASDRTQRARELEARIDEMERSGAILAAQAFYLRGAVAVAEFPGDPAARDAAVAGLEARYAAAAPSTSHLDARYQRLKAREREIIERAQARTVFPNGLTKEEYLRRELDAALEEAYAADSD